MVGVLPQPVFMALFGGAFICAAIYLRCVMKLSQNLRDLKRRGRALEAPDIHFSVAGVAGLIWLITGRYATLGDEAVTRWSTAARILLFLYIPVFLAMMANVIVDNVAQPLPTSQ